ncbi:hypothetical protein [Arthrobacter sp. ISL-65]|uniref:hypothetical protein n=1 Tax=Arthrobacter sp. ISL-65 TaxID=2819112 RepID=UPI001BE78C49|nr:hypothetical protein [Arthrobacter sp. ISL-65]MBT2550577.1 hypothetical protein [Arthrobacter sp. ISL-65]
MAIFTFNIIWVVFSLTVFLLPVIPLIRLAYPEYRARPLQAAAEVLLARAAVVLPWRSPHRKGHGQRRGCTKVGPPPQVS